MILPAILDPFVEHAAPAVMTRLALDWMLEGSTLDPILDDVGRGQYSREFLLGHFVEVLADVACGFRPSVRSAFLRRQLQDVASIRAFYAKLARMEPAVSEAVVAATAERARRLIQAAGGLLDEPIPGYSARIVDGNVLTGTDHRIGATRTTRAAALPGMSLAIYEPASGVVAAVILEENAHAQERSLFGRIAVEPGQLWIMDRNFCVRSLLGRIASAGAFFLARWHASALPFEGLGPPEPAGSGEGGAALEQPIRADGGPEQAGLARLRRIVIELEEPTRSGDTQVVLVTNLPAEVGAAACCRAYRRRWQIERHFQRLTDLLHCEVPGLGYPRAALFAFSMSVLAGNALAVLMGGLRAAHGRELAGEISEHAVVGEAAEVYPGMMVAAPPAAWPDLGESTAGELGGLLKELAAKVPIHRMLRSPRGPKKKRPPSTSGRRVHHVATKKLLDRAGGLDPPAKAGKGRAKG